MFPLLPVPVGRWVGFGDAAGSLPGCVCSYLGLLWERCPSAPQLETSGFNYGVLLLCFERPSLSLLIAPSQRSPSSAKNAGGFRAERSWALRQRRLVSPPRSGCRSRRAREKLFGAARVRWRLGVAHEALPHPWVAAPQCRGIIIVLRMLRSCCILRFWCQ